MRLRSFQRSCGLHPRAVLVVLLAFAIEIVPLPDAGVRHRHAGGDAPHVHAGRMAGVVRSDRAEGVERDAAPAGVRAAPASGLHGHLAPPLVVGALPTIVPLAPPPLVSPLPSVIVPDASPVALAPGRARSPPDQTA